MSKWTEMTAEYEWGFEKGEQAERERIIKLLKAHHKETKAGNTELSRKYEAAVLACIALIKGDNK